MLIHAICDALLGAANLRDIGYQFPDTSDEFLNIDSKILLRRTGELLNPHIPAMQETMAAVLGIDPDCLSIKATTTEKLGFEGRKEGITAYATVLIEKI